MTQRICSIEGCGNPVLVVKRGWCSAHYQCWLKYGDPLPAKPRQRRGAAREMLDLLGALETDDHVLWPLSLTACGYGSMAAGHVHSQALARRVPRPEGLWACHLPGIGCQRHCINYRHLYWGTQAQNEADKRIDGTIRKGEQHGIHRLTEGQVRAIRQANDDGVLNRRSVAAEYGVSRTTIDKVVWRQTWAWI